MMITVIRNTGTTLAGGSIAIKLNGKKVASVNPEERIQINLPEEATTLRVSQWGAKSKLIKVQNGETIEITSWKGTKTILILSVPFLFTVSTLINIYGPTVRFKMTALAIFAAVYLIAMFQINWYDLKKV